MLRLRWIEHVDYFLIVFIFIMTLLLIMGNDLDFFLIQLEEATVRILLAG